MNPEETPLLLVDTSGPRVQVGLWLRSGRWMAIEATDGDSLQTLFSLSRSVLARLPGGLGSCAGIIQCEGPGSLLGLRIAAMAVEAWRALPAMSDKPLYCYNSLMLAAALAARREGRLPVHVVADHKAGIWHAWSLGAEGSLGIDRQIPTWELPSARAGACFHLPQRKQWEKLPPHYRTLDYDLSDAADLLAIPGMLQRVDAPRVFQPTPTVYAEWSGERHRAPAPGAHRAGNPHPNKP